MRGLWDSEQIGAVAGQAFRGAEQDIELGGEMPDDEVTRVGIRHADIAEIVEHGWLGDPETRGDVGGGQVEINERDP